MGQELDQMHQMLQNVQKSMEHQTLKNDEFANDIRAYDAETKRLAALANAAQAPSAATIDPEVESVMKQYIRQILAEGLPEQEEPQELEQGEMHQIQPQQMPQDPM